MDDDHTEANETNDEKRGTENPGATWLEESEPASGGFGCIRLVIAGLTAVVGLFAGVPLLLLGFWSCIAVITLLRDYTTGLSPDITTLGCVWRLVSIGTWLAVVSVILESC